MIYLQEDIQAVKKYYPNIPDDVFMQLIALDPEYRDGSNSVGKNGKWILNLYNKGKLSEDDMEALPEILKLFKSYKNRLDDKDLNHYPSVSELESSILAVLDDYSMLSKRQRQRFAKQVQKGMIETPAEDDFEVFYEDSDFIVRIPHTHEASMKLGAGTEWCTANKNRDWFDAYTEQNDYGDNYQLYIIQNKHTGERYQFSDNTERDCQFMYENDTSVESPDEEFKDYPEFYEWMRDTFGQMCGLEYRFPAPSHTYGDFVIKGDTILGFSINADYDTYEIHITDDIMENGSDEYVACIGDGAFSECESLTTVIIDDGMEVIDDNAFCYCQNLTKVELPDSVRKIGGSAFQGTAIEEINIPWDIQVVGNNAFAYSNIKKATLPKTIYGSGVFQQSSLEEVTIGDGLRTITNWMFYGCFRLKMARLPASITLVGDWAFHSCPNVTLCSDSQAVLEYGKENNITVIDSNGEILYLKKDE